MNIHINIYYRHIYIYTNIYECIYIAVRRKNVSQNNFFYVENTVPETAKFWKRYPSFLVLFWLGALSLKTSKNGNVDSKNSWKLFND
jgi:hypothetical protein